VWGDDQVSSQGTIHRSKGLREMRELPFAFPQSPTLHLPHYSMFILTVPFAFKKEKLKAYACVLYMGSLAVGIICTLKN
ncbi:hypothetical protein ACQP3L_34065, partial [Escherichia coli]